MTNLWLDEIFKLISSDLKLFSLFEGQTWEPIKGREATTNGSGDALLATKHSVRRGTWIDTGRKPARNTYRWAAEFFSSEFLIFNWYFFFLILVHRSTRSQENSESSEQKFKRRKRKGRNVRFGVFGQIGNQRWIPNKGKRCRKETSFIPFRIQSVSERWKAGPFTKNLFFPLNSSGRKSKETRKQPSSRFI